jgi:hypothetical protein
VAIWNPNGNFGRGEPRHRADIEVKYDAAVVRQGQHPQLEKAIKVVMEELRCNPQPALKRPAYPDYRKKLG